MGLKRVKDSLWVCLLCTNCYGRGSPSFGARGSQIDSPPAKRCPPREFYKFKAYSTMGYTRTAWSVYNDWVKLNPEVANFFYTCCGCDMCSEHCKLVPALEINRAMREEIVDRGLLPDSLKKVDDNIESAHNPFGAKPEARAKWAEGLGLPKTGKTLYFAGCYASYRHPDTARATTAILKAAGTNVAFLAEDEWHCGLVPAWDGTLKLFEKMAEHNVEAIKAAGAETVIFSCPECYRTFKLDYPKVVGELPFKVTHVAELFAKLISEGKIKLSESKNTKITYHDPCHLGRHLKIYDEPRDVLNAIPGIELVEMEHSRQYSWCCGSGSGVVLNAHPDFSIWTASERLGEAKKAADTLVTACARCVNHLRLSARRKNIEISIIDLPVFLADAMKLTY